MEPTSDKILYQLNRIIESPAFIASDLLRKFLSYVVEQSLAGNSEKIKAYNIAVDAFGRDSGFDPQSDSIVRITASKLRKELVNYYNEYGNQDTVRIEIPKGKYIPEFSLIAKGKPDGIVTATPKPQAQKIKIYQFTLVLLLIILATVLVIKFSPDTDKFIEKPTIILYEFQNLTTDTSNDKWVVGFSEETAVLCSRFSEINVIGPVNEFSLLNKKEKLDELGNDIFELRGSIVSFDSILKVNVRLIDRNSGKVIWAKLFQDNVDSRSLLDIEYEISTSIANNISSIYGVVQNEVLKNSKYIKPTQLSSHLTILKYFHYLRTFNYEDYIVVKQELEKVIIADPNYATGWSALSALYLDGYMYYNEDSTESFTNAHVCLSRALEIEPENVFVQSHRVYYSYLSRDLVNFYNAMEKEESLNASNIMMGEVGVFLILIGDSEKGLKLIEKAQNMSVVYPGYYHAGTFIYYYRKGEFKEALTEVELANMPYFFIDPLFRSVALYKLGDVERAKLAKEEVLELIPSFSTDGYAILNRILYLKSDINNIVIDFNSID